MWDDIGVSCRPLTISELLLLHCLTPMAGGDVWQWQHHIEQTSVTINTFSIYILILFVFIPVSAQKRFCWDCSHSLLVFDCLFCKHCIEPNIDFFCVFSRIRLWVQTFSEAWTLVSEQLLGCSRFEVTTIKCYTNYSANDFNGERRNALVVSLAQGHSQQHVWEIHNTNVEF